eukprot:1158843-Pelagomonas_calceolata.AAC.11
MSEVLMTPIVPTGARVLMHSLNQFAPCMLHHRKGNARREGVCMCMLSRARAEQLGGRATGPRLCLSSPVLGFPGEQTAAAAERATSSAPKL